MIDFHDLLGRKTIQDLDVRNKTVLVRVDFNVPVSKDKIVLDDTRMMESLPTISYLLDQNAKVILVSHFKRPKGWDSTQSLRVVVPKLQEILNRPVHFLEDPVGSESLREKVRNIENGQVILLENIRFYPEETLNDEDFSKQLAGLCDVYLNDAFGTMHRSHASTAGIAAFVPSGLGFLPVKEIEYVERLVLQSKHPLTVILGGGKVSSKMGVLEGLLSYADHVLIGGGMTFTFWKALGFEIGNSFYEADVLPETQKILNNPDYRKKIVLPVDIVTASAIQEGVSTQTVLAEEGIPSDKIGLDIGPKTSQLFKDIISKSETLFWNGPMGVFEIPPFDKGTRAIALAVGKIAEKPGVLTLVGGGESAMAARLYGIASQLSHISTGGGALLELLEGAPLPGVMAINRKKSA